LRRSFFHQKNSRRWERIRKDKENHHLMLDLLEKK
jgi:hypothetical protein